MNLAPVILFVYNRPSHTAQVLNALEKNEFSKETELFIISDGAKSEVQIENVKAVRSLIRKYKGFKKVNIKENERNFGLANNTILNVTEVIQKYKKIIFLEDDDVPDNLFLTFMNESLNKYEEHSNVFSVGGYSPNLKQLENHSIQFFLHPRPSGWGFGTWLNRWELVDWSVKDREEFIKRFDYQQSFNKGGNDLTDLMMDYFKGKIDSWSIRWAYAHFKNKSFCLMPVQSFVQNIGHDNTGTHCEATHKWDVNINIKNEKKIKLPDNLKEDWDLIRNINAQFYNYPLRWSVRSYIKRFLNANI